MSVAAPQSTAARNAANKIAANVFGKLHRIVITALPQRRSQRSASGRRDTISASSRSPDNAHIARQGRPKIGSSQILRPSFQRTSLRCQPPGKMSTDSVADVSRALSAPYAHQFWIQLSKANGIGNSFESRELRPGNRRECAIEIARRRCVGNIYGARSNVKQRPTPPSDHVYNPCARCR